MRMAFSGFPNVGCLLIRPISGFLGSAVGWFFSDRTVRESAFRFAACLSLLALLGCGKATGPEFAPVTGRVTINGQPLAAGTIHFVPDESQVTSGPMSTGVVQADGSFSLRGPGRHDGAMVGNHRVYLTAPPPEIGPTPIVVDGEVVIQEPTRGAAAITAQQIPKKYLQAETSEWTAAVATGVANVFDFEIKK
jgi:hypothetical protein